MDIFIDYLKAFLVGGLLCALGQLLIDKTKLTPAKILVTYVIAGVVLTAFGIYDYLIEWGGAGASVPLTGFGYTLVNGMEKAIEEKGIIGLFTGPFTAMAGGVGAAVLFAYFVALFAKSKDKS